jgi:hypothetical protein
MAAIALDPATGRARVEPDTCVECYACFRGMSMEKLNPTLVRAARKFLGVFRLRFEPEPDPHHPLKPVVGRSADSFVGYRLDGRDSMVLDGPRFRLGRRCPWRSGPLRGRYASGE